MESINWGALTTWAIGELDDAVVPSFEKVVDCLEGVEEMVNRGGIEDAVRHLYGAKQVAADRTRWV